MADYYTYRRNIKAQKRRRVLVLAAVVLLAVLCAGAGYFWMNHDAAPAAAPTPSATAEAALPTAAATATPETAAPQTPQRLLPAVDTAAWDTAAAAAQTIDTEYLNTDAKMIGLPMLGTVTRSHFDTATFLGDSITQGMELYDAGFPNAKTRAYKGAGPNTVVNNASVADEIRHVNEVPLDAVAETQPDYLYVLFGTNSLVAQGNEESFIAYYDKMIDMLRERLPGVTLYIQAIPGVQETVKDTTPGLDNDRIRVVNNLLANLSLRKGCYFVNIQEALTYPDGSQIDEYQTNDGIHMQPSGYAAWTDYLATHTAWEKRNVYAGQNPCYILGT